MKLTYTPADGGPAIEKEVFKAPGGGVTLAMYNLDDSISGFARACFNYGLDRDYPVYLSHEEHDSEGLRRPLQEPLPGNLRRRVQGQVRRRRS